MTEYDYTTQKRPWTRVFILLSLLLLIGVLVWAVFFRTTSVGEPTQHHTTVQTTSPPAKSPQKSTTSTSTPKTTPKPAPKKTTSQASTSTTAPSSSGLSNTGPGNVVALFIGASIFGVACNYVRLYRKSRHTA